MMPLSRKRMAEALSRPGIRLRGFRRLPVMSRIAVVVLGIIVLTALLAPLIAPHDPLDQAP